MSVIERLRQIWLRLRCREEFLCDNCKYDYASACKNPQRPNVKKCTEYKPK